MLRYYITLVIGCDRFRQDPFWHRAAANPFRCPSFGATTGVAAMIMVTATRMVSGPKRALVVRY